MPRDLGNELNELKMRDAITNEKFSLFYKTPEPKDFERYTNLLVVRKGKKVINQTGQVRQLFGSKIFAGFSDNYLKNKGEFISCNESSEDYFPEWKQFVKDNAPDLIEAIAMRVFEVAPELDDDDNEDPVKNS